MARDILGNYSDRLDDLLGRISGKLQLTPTQHAIGEDRYKTIADWLAGDGSPLAPYHPNVYPQGSFRIGTSVKPKGRDEFDVDLVCEFDASARSAFTPASILDAVEHRLRDNGRYEGMIMRMDRCLRLNYAGEFHMDILPAFALSGDNQDTIVIPDEERREWLLSNPKGYAAWFEERAATVRYFSTKTVEELPEIEKAEDKSPLARLVQLWKRARDISYADRSEAPPPSIVLTTIAGYYYTGISTVSLALDKTLDCLVRQIQMNGAMLEVRNPVISSEDFSETWKLNYAAYLEFVRWVRHLRDEWRLLLNMQGQGFEAVAEKLVLLFGETVSKTAIKEQASYMEELRAQQRLYVNTASQSLSTVQTTRSTPIVRNTFFGS